MSLVLSTWVRSRCRTGSGAAEELEEVDEKGEGRRVKVSMGTFFVCRRPYIVIFVRSRDHRRVKG